MTDDDCDRLIETLLNVQFSDQEPDGDVRRHTTGLIKSIVKFQVNRWKAQARIGSPRHSGLASTTATLDRETEDG